MTIQALSKLYVAIHENRVEAFATNLKDFAKALAELEPNAKPYHTLRRNFDGKTELEFKGDSGKDYRLQEVYNANKTADLSDKAQ